MLSAAKTKQSENDPPPNEKEQLPAHDKASAKAAHLRTATQDLAAAEAALKVAKAAKAKSAVELEKAQPVKTKKTKPEKERTALLKAEAQDEKATQDLKDAQEAHQLVKDVMMAADAFGNEGSLSPQVAADEHPYL